MLSVLMLSVIMPSVIMLSVIMLNVIMLSVIMLSVIMLSVVESWSMIVQNWVMLLLDTSSLGHMFDNKPLTSVCQDNGCL